MAERKRKRSVPNGGSIYQRKSDERWVASFIEEATGKRKNIYAKTEKEAIAKLQQALYEQKQGLLTTGTRQKLKDYIERWLEDVHKPNVRLSTYARHRTIIFRHILPTLGHIELKKLTPQHIQRLYADKEKEGLAKVSVKAIHCVLHNALKNAVRWKLVAQNVCDMASPPRAPERETQILTKEQTLRLLQVARGHQLEAFIALALTTGMRHGELIGLRWKDINFHEGTLHIRHAVYRLGGYGYLEGDPKTKSSNRTIVVPKFVMETLIAHRILQKEAQLKAGPLWKEKDLVFCNQYGDFLNSDTNLRRFRALLQEADLPRIRLHDLRHSAATLLIMVMKYPPNLVQSLLGHSDIRTTLGTYTHADPDMLRKMMNDLNDLFGNDLS